MRTYALKVIDMPEREIRIMPVGQVRQATAEETFLGTLTKEKGCTAREAREILDIVNGVRSGAMVMGYDPRYQQTIDAIRNAWRRLETEERIPADKTSVAQLSAQNVRALLQDVRGPSQTPEERPQVAATPTRVFRYDVTIDGTTYKVALDHQLEPQNKQGQMREALREAGVTVVGPTGTTMAGLEFARIYVPTYNEWTRDHGSHELRVVLAERPSSGG